MIRYWLVKTEPHCFSIEHLAKSPKQTTFWDGVRNYQARNFMREMKVGDRVLFYHSGAQPAVAGTALVVREAYPDHTALDPKNDHYDLKATHENPIWEMVDIKLDRVFPRPIALEELRGLKELANMELLRRGSRLSVQPVREEEWKKVLELAERRVDSADGRARAASKAKKMPANKITRKGAKLAKP